MLWSSAIAPRSERPIFVKQSDFAELEGVLAKGDYWPKVYRVLPNGEGPLPLIAFLLTISSESPSWCVVDHSLSIAQGRLTPRNDRLRELGARVANRDLLLSLSIGDVSVDYRALLRSGIDSVLAVQSLEGHGLLLAARSLSAESKALSQLLGVQIHPLTPSLADWLGELAEEVLLSISQGVIDEQAAPLPATKNWWRASAALASRCQELRKSLHLVAVGFPSMPFVKKFDDWLGKLIISLQRLTVPIGATIERHAEAFFVASAWFCGCALRAMETGLASRALIYLHRSAEWLLMGKAVSLDLIAFDVHGGRYKNPAEYGERDDQPGFGLHMRILRQFSGLRFYELDSFLMTLNDWRNLHPLAHHMSTPAMPVAEKLFYDIVGHLPRFAAQDVWTDSLAAFAVTPDLELSDLLDPDGLLRGAVLS